MGEQDNALLDKAMEKAIMKHIEEKQEEIDDNKTSDE